MLNCAACDIALDHFRLMNIDQLSIFMIVTITAPGELAPVIHYLSTVLPMTLCGHLRCDLARVSDDGLLNLEGPGRDRLASGLPWLLDPPAPAA